MTARELLQDVGRRASTDRDKFDRLCAIKCFATRDNATRTDDDLLIVRSTAAELSSDSLRVRSFRAVSFICRSTGLRIASGSLCFFDLPGGQDCRGMYTLRRRRIVSEWTRP